MDNRQTSVWENSLIWFGAAVSIAEIVTGTLFAPLGLARGLLAIVLGHVIGCGLMVMAAYIGGKTRRSAMETVMMSFGRRGSAFFSVLNVVQLFGWTAIMIYDGGLAVQEAWPLGQWFWCALIGALIVLWIWIGIEHLGKLNVAAMTALTILTVVLSFSVFGGAGMPQTESDTLSFGAALELSIAMPLSWLPLISDYTREAARPKLASAASAAVYGIVSCWMYTIGMGAALFAGTGDIAQIMVKAGLGVAALLIVVLSTVTTTFLDAYSAGISAEALSGKLRGKWIAITAAVFGTVGAIVFPMTDITDFLYLIGSVFAPMAAIQFADFYFLRSDKSAMDFCWKNVLIWLFGFIVYRLLMRVELPIGNTVPDMLLTFAVCALVHMLSKTGPRAANLRKVQ